MGRAKRTPGSLHAADGLGQRLPRLRAAAHLRQEDLADRVGVSQSWISQIETGVAAEPLKPRTLRGLADALGVDLVTLVGGLPAYSHLDLDDGHAPTAALAPRPTTPLIGREEDIAAAAALVRAGQSLVTFVGPGGVGKTQLALAVAAELAPDGWEQVFTVSLAQATDPGSVLAAVARGVELRESDNRLLRDRLLRDLPAGRVLLLLDNVEQAIAPVAALCADLLAVYRQLTLLVTSRAALLIQGESLFPVLPLAVPDLGTSVSASSARDAPAVALFEARARTRSPGFAVTEANAAHVAAICKRLDGLPLAIELAAVRVRIYTPAQLLQQVEQGLAILSSTARDLPERQQSLQASIAWSCDLLAPAEVVMLRRLAVFADGFTLEAAAAVVGPGSDPGETSVDRSRRRLSQRTLIATADSIATLVEQHLLTSAEQADGMPRFGMLETIHAYAREQLELEAEEASAYRQRHLAWCLALAEQAAPAMYTSAESGWLATLRQEDANLLAALEWAFASADPTAIEHGLRLAGVLTDYWYISGQLSRGRTWLTRAAAVAARRQPSLGKASALAGAGLIAQVQADTTAAASYGEQALALAAKLDDQPTLARAQLLLGNLAMMRGELDVARRWHEAALAGFTALGDRPWRGAAVINLGLGAYAQGELQTAERYGQAGLDITRDVGNRWDRLVALRLLGDIRRDRGQLDQAAELFAESLALARLHESEREVADSLSGMGAVAIAQEDFVLGARYLGAAEKIYRRLGIALPPPLRPDWRRLETRVREGLPADVLAEAWCAGAPDLHPDPVMAP